MHNHPREPQPYEDCQAQDRLSDEMLDQGPDSLWSLKNPMALLVKSRGVTPVSWPNSHHWPLSIMAS